MHRPTITLLAAVLFFPPAVEAAPAKAAAAPARAVAPPAPLQMAASSKGTRLIAQDPQAASPRPALKAAVAKADKMIKSVPAPANLPVSPTTLSSVQPPQIPTRLARVTAYWTQEDPWTAQHQSSTGIRLRAGVCAVDPKVIPYGSLLNIPGMGNYVAVDTGSAVISRQAARGFGRTAAERNALVVDLFFESRQEAENFAAHGPAYVAVSWIPRSLAGANSALNSLATAAVPTLPAGAIYQLAEAPSLADARMPLTFRPPQLAGL